MKTIRLGKHLTFPADELATQVVCAFGMRGSGKSNVMALAAEGMMDASIPIIIVDSVGIWFSLRLQPDGKTPSRFKIPVLGGAHGDIDLQPTAGVVIANALATSHGSAILDISRFSKGDRSRFCADFFETFMRAKMENRGPVCVFGEEAQRLAPQKLLFPTPYLTRMLGAVEEMAETGRNYGIGLFLASLRPQKVNKDVANLAAILFGFQSNGVAERKAIAEWVQEAGAKGREDVNGQLPGLPRGTALVWAPSRGLYQKHELLLKSTYDAGATPTGQISAVKVRPLDLSALEAEMAEVVEKAKADDPRHLRARVAELEAALRKAPTARAAPPADRIVYHVPEKQPDLVGLLLGLLGSMDGELSCLVRDLKAAGSALRSLDILTSRVMEAAGRLPAVRVVEPASGPFVAVTVPAKPTGGHIRLAGEEKLPRGALEMLAALATSNATGLTRRQVATLSGIKVTGGTFAKYLSILNVGQFLEVHGTELRLTDKGRAVSGDVQIPRGRKDLLAYWKPKLPGRAGDMLQRVFDNPGLSDEDWAAGMVNQSGEPDPMQPSGGTWAKYKSILVTRGLVEKRGREFYPAEIFA